MAPNLEDLKQEVWRKQAAFKEALHNYTVAATESAVFNEERFEQGFSGINLPYFLLGYETEQRPLPALKLEGCTVLNCRQAIIERMPGNGRAIEVGTQTGAFARFILNTHPEIRLDVIDYDYSAFRHEKFESEIESGQISIIEGSSREELSKFEEDTFDWIYIDASHFYPHVKNDLEIARRKVRPGGYIVCNDYTCWSPFEAEPYGVMQAVNEVVSGEDFKVDYFAFDSYGYHDIALRRIC